MRLVQQHIAVVGGGSGKQEGVLGVLRAHVQAVLKPFQGHLVDCLCRICMYCCGPLLVCMPHKVEDDLGVHHLNQDLWLPYCRGRESASPSRSGTVPRMATAHMLARSAAKATLVACLQPPPPPPTHWRSCGPRALGFSITQRS